jgi:hypothetical protein
MAQAGGDPEVRDDVRAQVAVWTAPAAAEGSYAGTVDPEYLLVYRVLAGHVDDAAVVAKGPIHAPSRTHTRPQATVRGCRALSWGAAATV